MYPDERLIVVRDFCGFLCSRGVRIPANFHVVVGMIRKIKMAPNWFGHICVVFFSTSRWCSRKRSANLLPVSGARRVGYAGNRH